MVAGLLWKKRKFIDAIARGNREVTCIFFNLSKPLVLLRNNGIHAASGTSDALILYGLVVLPSMFSIESFAQQPLALITPPSL